MEGKVGHPFLEGKGGQPVQNLLQVTPVPVTVPQPQPSYIPLLDNPPVQSLGNSGWQVSDVWRDLRVDRFCD
nr:hypothetical protein [Nostoc sp. FACHB-110]